MKVLAKTAPSIYLDTGLRVKNIPEKRRKNWIKTLDFCKFVKPCKSPKTGNEKMMIMEKGMWVPGSQLDKKQKGMDGKQKIRMKERETNNYPPFILNTQSTFQYKPNSSTLRTNTAIQCKTDQNKRGPVIWTKQKKRRYGTPKQIPHEYIDHWPPVFFNLQGIHSQNIPLPLPHELGESEGLF